MSPVRGQLKFLVAPESCRICGLPCVTVKVGGRTPLHVGCDSRDNGQPVDLDVCADAIATLAQAFAPDLSANPKLAEWLPHEVGPCVRCRRPCRRYGVNGAASCQPTCKPIGG